MVLQSCLIRRATHRSCPHIQSAFRSSQVRQLHSSAARRDEHGLPNHYETLEIEPNASPAEIKKQFYKLSKSHHPDLHPNDSTAPQRFVKISEAYATLGSPERRARYDRDFLRAHQAPSPNRPSGSYSSASATPFGGRAASGLSRRRTQFRGPPPSFYSSGGWGQHSEKRGEAASQASHTNEAQGRAQSNANPTGGGMGPGGSEQGFDVPHFDQRAHAQTQSKIEQRRHKARGKSTRNRMEEAEREQAGSPLFNFTWVSGMLLAIFLASGKMTSETSVRKKQPLEES